MFNKNNILLKSNYKNISGGSLIFLKKICKIYGLNINQKLNLIKNSNFYNINIYIEKLKLNNFKLKKLKNIQKLKNVNNYRGMRHVKNLPVRGQRTKTNAKTRKKRFVF